MKNHENEDETQKFGNFHRKLKFITLIQENFLWGELLEEEEPEEIDEAPIENYGDTAQSMISKTESETKSGISSIISGLDTPNIDIRKPMAMKSMAETKQNLYDSSGKPLYQILEQSQVIIINSFIL